ncbi:hypothetical protein KIW84_034335 [Lathyrus oleraceus]|uniref:Uncharacterized protein n=1 Tax=Pisum sativum TaxID=3888 RepID=A0A9D4Y032_PEA|nr:hypothetical protein KIW84_034335 [Pisum sativum]
MSMLDRLSRPRMRYPAEGDYFTWLNKHSDNVIYSRIDHALANDEWYQKYANVNLDILAPSIFDHSFLFLQNPDTTRQRRQYHLNFLNNVVKSPNFLEKINHCRRVLIHGSPMFVLWRKLIRTQFTIRQLSKPVIGAFVSLKNARLLLVETQELLMNDKENLDLIQKVKMLTSGVFKWSTIEE